MDRPDPQDPPALKAKQDRPARKERPAPPGRRDRQAPKAQQVVKALAELRALWGHKDPPDHKATPDTEA